MEPNRLAGVDVSAKLAASLGPTIKKALIPNVGEATVFTSDDKDHFFLVTADGTRYYKHRDHIIFLADKPLNREQVAA